VGLFRDVDIVLLDASAPDAGGALLPAGRLREPLAALARADLIVITRSEQADPAAAAALAARHAPGVPVLQAVTEIVGIRGPHGEAVPVRDLRGASLVAVAGLARPEVFASTLHSLEIEPEVFLAFRDHARYRAAELGRIVRAAAESEASAIVTTEKDAVKLESVCPLPLFTVAIGMRVVEPGFLGDLFALLERRPS
jgi:tetraacyldisaccharide 4'-kinase